VGTSLAIDAPMGAWSTSIVPKQVTFGETRVSKLHQIETTSKQAALIHAMIDDLERRAQILRVDVSIEEERARVFDRADPSYPMIARSLLTRVENLELTIANLKNQLISVDPENAARRAA
jgi:hypothetical protein